MIRMLTVLLLVLCLLLNLLIPGVGDEIGHASAQGTALKKLVIDPGHGGTDPGAMGFVIEKEINLEMSLMLQDYLKKNYLVDIMMIRDRDVFLSLTDRTALANAWGADFYFSVHSNAGGGYGYEDFIHNTNACSEAVRIRDEIHPYISKVWVDAGSRNRGKKTANFTVLRETKMPAMLVELGFVDSESDAVLLKNDAFKNKLAKAIGEGIAVALRLPPLFGMDGPDIKANENWTSAEKVSVSISSASNAVDYIEYSLAGATVAGWKKYTGAFNIRNEGKTVIMARNVFSSLDMVSDASNATIRIDRTGPGEPVINLNNANWTHEDVTVSVARGIDAGEKIDFSWKEASENDFTVGELNNVVAGGGGGLKLDRWEESFEAGNSLVLGNLSVSRDKGALKSGDFGLKTTPKTHGQLLAYDSMCRGDDFYLSGWVRTDTGYDVSGLTGLTFGVPWDLGNSGYQAVIDVRNQTDDKAAFQLRRNYWARLDFDDSIKVQPDTWYRIEVFWDNNGKITAVLYDTAGKKISELTAVDNTYDSGLFGIAAYSNSSFDDLSAGRNRKPESDIVIGHTAEFAAGNFHHVLFKAQEDFSGDLKLMAFNKSVGFKNSGKLEFASVSDANGSSYKVIKEVAFAAGQKEVNLYDIKLERGKHYVLGHSNGYYRFPTKERPAGKYIDILKGGYIRSEIGTDLYNRTYGYAEYIFTPSKISGSRISPPLDLGFLGVAATSKITWDSWVPSKSKVKIETSLDGKKWTEAVNGSAVPGIKAGDNLDKKKLYIRQTLETECDYSGPVLRFVNVDITGAIEGSGVAKTQYRVGKEGSWIDYSKSFAIGNDGITEIYARSTDRVGNIGKEAVAVVRIDRAPPKIDLEMIKSDGSVYRPGTRTPLDITVSPVVTASNSGVTIDSLFYSLNEGASWKSYADPLTFSGEGIYSLVFKGSDTLGNIIKVQEFVRIGDPGPGDVNGDGEITVTDAIAILRYIVGLADLGEDELIRARVNCIESGPTVNDAILVLRFVVGILSLFPAESNGSVVTVS